MRDNEIKESLMMGKVVFFVEILYVLCKHNLLFN